MAAHLARRAPAEASPLAVSEVRAAGGIVTRPNDPTRVLLVHRPRYDDWSLPKGKADGDELDEATALREVEEETGLQCALLDEVGETRYVDGRGRAKVVRYWHMEPIADRGFSPNAEVDELRWCSLAEAHALLTYPHDRVLLRQFEEPA